MIIIKPSRSVTLLKKALEFYSISTYIEPEKEAEVWVWRWTSGVNTLARYIYKGKLSGGSTPDPLFTCEFYIRLKTYSWDVQRQEAQSGVQLESEYGEGWSIIEPDSPLLKYFKHLYLTLLVED